jgi:hypothetical protein
VEVEVYLAVDQIDCLCTLRTVHSGELSLSCHENEVELGDYILSRDDWDEYCAPRTILSSSPHYPILEGISLGLTPSDNQAQAEDPPLGLVCLLGALVNSLPSGFQVISPPAHQV